MSFSLPGIYVDRTLTYPDVTQWGELFEEFQWFKSEPIYRTVPRRKTKRVNYAPPRQELTGWSKPSGNWIRIQLPRGKDRVPDRWGLYGKPTPMLAQYVQGMNLSGRHIELSAHDTYLLVILTTHVSAYIHLAILPPQAIDELPPLVIPELGEAQESSQE